MRQFRLSRWSTALSAVVGVAIATGAGIVIASDHQDTPEVELNSRMDINDVYAFPGSSADRIALVMTTSSPIIGTTASFDPNLLYQIKIDNSSAPDGVEDLVFQITFTNNGSTVNVRGPVAPGNALMDNGMRYRLITTGTTVSGPVGQTLGSATGTQVFAGLRRDPFFIDLEQFFRIIPDRRPATGPLSAFNPIDPPAFRNPGVDILGYGTGGLRANALAIAIELPRSQLVSSTAATARMGVWGTISR